MNRDRQLVLHRLNRHLRQILRLFIKIAITGIVTKLCFENHSFTLARDVTRRNMMKVTKVRQRAREVEDVASSANVDAHGEVAFDGEIVNSGEMKRSCCLFARESRTLGSQTQTRL